VAYEGWTYVCFSPGGHRPQRNFGRALVTLVAAGGAVPAASVAYVARWPGARRVVGAHRAESCRRCMAAGRQLIAAAILRVDVQRRALHRATAPRPSSRWRATRCSSEARRGPPALGHAGVRLIVICVWAAVLAASGSSTSC